MTEIEKQHASDLENVQKQVRFFYSRKRKVKIYHGSTNSTRSLRYEHSKVVDVSKFNRIISINADEKYILVEPNVPMDKLVEETLKHRLVPPVVMEFPGITVGGGIQGGAGESSSFKYGLFHGTACSYGSLGIITLVKLRLIPAKDFVRLQYHAVKNFDEAINLTEKKVGETVQFVDGIIFEKNRGVVMVGNFTDKSDLPVSTFSKARDEWFYLHADKISKRHEKYEEIIPVKDYLFRYDRGGFWMGKYGFSFFKVPFNRFTRFIFNSFCTTRALYRSLHSANFSQRYLIQDFSLPKEGVLNFLEYIEKNLHTYPLWVCPLKPANQAKLSPNCLKTNLVINVGVWGEVRKDFSHFVELNRDLEKFVDNLGGRKVLYAHAYYSRDEFWKIYDFEWYNALRDKYYANITFPDIYEKTFVSREYKPTIFGGLYSLIKSPFKIPNS
ncbi:MAG: FAD-binding oxidoreductase [Candidatus Portnoybacteria bacterium]|nr:FAD-binding oxidoreductase [Candidatus Portnoybacteria bacterium]